MEIMNFTIILGASLVCFVFFILFLIILYVLYKLNKKIDSMNQDVSDALTKMIAYQSKEFNANSESHQQMVDWLYSNFEKILELNNQCFNSFSNQSSFTSNSLSIIMEMLGYRPKFDENVVERPQVNYGQPPAPKKIEGLRINDRDK